MLIEIRGEIEIGRQLSIVLIYYTNLLSPARTLALGCLSLQVLVISVWYLESAATVPTGIPFKF